MIANNKDISNTVLGKFLSLEFLGIIVMTAIAWGTLTQRVTGLEEKIDENDDTYKVHISELRTESANSRQEVAQINRKLDVMSNNQEHFKEQIDSLAKRSEKMLDILEKEQK